MRRFDIFGDYIEESDEEYLTRMEEEAERADEYYVNLLYGECDEGG